MMPQKLNPDVAELVRGKAGTAAGRLAGLLAVLKGLPLTYNMDLQEDKEAVFSARRDLGGALPALATLLRHAEFRRDRLETVASDPLLLATDAAETLVQSGVPFRDAYTQIAGLVRSGTFEAERTAAESVAARPAPGPGGVREALAEARRRFA